LILVLHCFTCLKAETILLLGGEVDSFLHPAVDTVNTFGPCGVFNSDLPPLPTPRREFAATLLGNDLIICGGYGLFSTDKVLQGFYICLGTTRLIIKTNHLTKT